MKKETTRIVLVGGGYSSIWAYRAIVRDLLIEMILGRVKVILVCPEAFHYYHGWTAESLMGIIEDQNRMSALSEIFKFAEIIPGSVVKVDTQSNTLQIKLNDGLLQPLVYDHLFLGLGSTDQFSVEGLAENGYTLKSHRAYLRTKMRLQILIGRAMNSDLKTAKSDLQFVIAGGGFTGIEIAANLAELFKDLKITAKNNRAVLPVIYLINSRKDILPELDCQMEYLREYAKKVLNGYGVEIRNQVKISRVTARGVWLSDGSFVESKMVISAIGQCCPVLAGTEKLEKDSQNKLLTNSFLQLKNHPEIWGAGDGVHVTCQKTGRACAPNALWAIKQGEHAGKNIARTILSQTLKPFRFNSFGQCASLGIGKGMGELYGIPFTGWSAWIMRWVFFQIYMPSKKVMLGEIWNWIGFLISGKRKEFRYNQNKLTGVPRLTGSQDYQLSNYFQNRIAHPLHDKN